MRTLRINTSKKTEFIDMTAMIQKELSEQKATEGICYVFVPHTTAGITINENADPSVREDIRKQLDKMVPLKADYSHTEGNSAAHIKASIMGSSVCVFVNGGKFVLGTWQGIYLCEFDGPRTRKVCVDVFKK